MVTAAVPDLSADIGVTDSAVRQKLARLEAAGFVSREAVREGRGRPHHRYRLTDSGLDSLDGSYRELAVMLWREVTAIEDSAIRDRILGQLRSAMVRELNQSVTAESVSDRIRELGVALGSRGVMIETPAPRNRGELPVLRELSCPFHAVACEDSSICDLEQSVFSEVLGADVELTNCCHGDGGACEFTVSGSDGS